MSSKTGTGRGESEHTRERDRMREEALAKPGIREFMMLYGDERDRRMVGVHRATTKVRSRGKHNPAAS